MRANKTRLVKALNSLIGASVLTALCTSVVAEVYDLPVEDVSTMSDVDSLPVVNVTKDEIKVNHSHKAADIAKDKPSKTYQVKGPGKKQYKHEKQTNYHVGEAGKSTEEWRRESSRYAKARIKKQEKEHGLSQVATYDVLQGGNIIIPIGHALLNRIQTPFAKAKILTANEGHMFTEDGDFYVAVADTKPLSVILSEDGVPESSFSVTLVPKLNMPPTMAHVHIPFTGKVKQQLRQAKTNHEWAKSENINISDAQNPTHIDSIKRMMKPLPMGETPAGFNLLPSFEPISDPCDNDLEEVEGQRLEGARHNISVYLVKNQTDMTASVYEETCYKSNVLAVAVFPLEKLMPGQQTELYVLRSKDKPHQPTSARKRPSLLPN
jgi:conjugal transfer pilus assembly protein TraK